MDGQHLIPISAVNQKLSPGNSIDPFIVRTIHGKEVSIPDREGRWTHLQFRRFAGCPICNLHLQTFIIGRSSGVQNAGNDYQGACDRVLLVVAPRPRLIDLNISNYHGRPRSVERGSIASEALEERVELVAVARLKPSNRLRYQSQRR